MALIWTFFSLLMLIDGAFSESPITLIAAGLFAIASAIELHK